MRTAVELVNGWYNAISVGSGKSTFLKDAFLKSLLPEESKLLNDGLPKEMPDE